MKKNNIIIVSTITFFSILSISFLLYLIKKYLKNNKKLIKVIANILTKPIQKKNKKLINEFLNLIIKIYNIKSLSLITENDEFHRSKNICKNEHCNLSEDIKYKNNIIGFLKISFIQ